MSFSTQSSLTDGFTLVVKGLTVNGRFPHTGLDCKGVDLLLFVLFVILKCSGLGFEERDSKMSFGLVGGLGLVSNSQNGKF